MYTHVPTRQKNIYRQNKALQMRKEQAGSLLQSTRAIKSIQIKVSEDFVLGCHTASSEPYFYDSAYQPVKRDSAIPVSEDGKCITAKELEADSKTHKKKQKQWECTSECKPLTKAEIDAIVAFKEAFEKPMQDVRLALDSCDEGCPNQHYAKVVDIYNAEFSTVDRIGHPLVCSNDGGCQSVLRILRAASTHYPVLRNFLHHVNTGIRCHMLVFDIDKALRAGDFHTLMEITKMVDFEAVLSNDVQSSFEHCTDGVTADSVLRQPNLESQLQITHAHVITQLEKEIDDFPDNVCCSCERLHQRKSVMRVKLTDELSSDVWPRLKNFILERNPDAAEQVLYMCNYCKPIVKRNKLPPRCVLNGLQTVPIPEELASLDPLSRQFVQRAKCYQTVVRLGTYTAKVPVYNSLKACKGTMFFLPLPLNKTLETLDQVEASSDALPDPELYILVNGRPTKSTTNASSPILKMRIPSK